ncbi:MAG: thioredoxin-dependent thiol peroxidase [Alphaproteobacteria bacterium]|nr:thioredoxin-dependent thiol peroxidase [Alphaproteobacteria bacterium]MCB9984201.1 thioredoxin-dependent thiol peroxidase [Micavibrio sp.]
MPQIDAGDKAPYFSAPGDSGETISIKDYAGQTFVLYFYPKDDTPGCTKEACHFSESLSKFNALDVPVIGVSKDSVEKHKKFKEKYGLNFPLLSDENGELCDDYGTWVEKSMYGRKYMGIDRATFVIDAKGIISAAWRKVKVTGHIEEVLKFLKNQ